MKGILLVLAMDREGSIVLRSARPKFQLSELVSRITPRIGTTKRIGAGRKAKSVYGPEPSSDRTLRESGFEEAVTLFFLDAEFVACLAHRFNDAVADSRYFFR